MLAWRESGMTQQDIADKLNEQGHTTRRGKPWNQVQVLRVLHRAEAAFDA
jgi:DNA-binding CsgD family transcriptional regulator